MHTTCVPHALPAEQDDEPWREVWYRAGLGEMNIAAPLQLESSGDLSRPGSWAVCAIRLGTPGCLWWPYVVGYATRFLAVRGRAALWFYSEFSHRRDHLAWLRILNSLNDPFDVDSSDFLIQSDDGTIATAYTDPPQHLLASDMLVSKLAVSLHLIRYPDDFQRGIARRLLAASIEKCYYASSAWNRL